MPGNPIRVCYISGRENSYSRTRIILKALRSQGFDVVACIPPDKRFRHYPALILQFLFRKRACDVVIVGFYGQLLMPFVRLFTRKPILFDVIVSTCEVMADWRQKKVGWLKHFVYFWADKLSMAFADRVILETNDHIHRRSSYYGIDKGKFERVFIPTDESVMYPAEMKQRNRKFLVHFHGEFAPFHGVRYIIEAADLLRKEDIEFQLIGRGITYEQDRALADHLGVNSINFIDAVPYDELGEYIRRADVCLGIFGDNQRAREELTNKVVEQLASKKPLITATNPPVEELVVHGESVILVKPADSRQIADAILQLKNDPVLRDNVAKQGYLIYQEKSSLPVFSVKLGQIIRGLALSRRALGVTQE